MDKKKLNIAERWVRDEISHAEVCRELDINATSAYIMLARALKELYGQSNNDTDQSPV